MKLKRDFIIHDTESETLLVPAGNADFSGLVKGNRTFKAILEFLREGGTEEELVGRMSARFDASEELIRRDVERALSELRKIGAIEE